MTLISGMWRVIISCEGRANSYIHHKPVRYTRDIAKSPYHNFTERVYANPRVL